jgi:NADPH:quinone reductase-like Zn-dependent oxidoreductase
VRAVLMTAVGGPEVLKLANAPEPDITGPHDVRVLLRAAGINPVDYKLRAAGLIGGSLRAILEQAAAHFDAGDLRVEVGATFPLTQAADAHRALEAGQVVGKAVLTIP